METLALDLSAPAVPPSARVPRRELISAAEYARRAGLNKSTIKRQIDSGIIPTHGRGKGGAHLVDPEEADAARRAAIDPGKQLASRQADTRRSGGQRTAAPRDAAVQAPAPVSALVERKIEDLGETIREKRLKNEERAGELVRRAAVAARTAEIFGGLRTRLLALPARIAGRLVSIRTERELAAALEDEIAAVLSESADELAPPDAAA